MPNPIITDLRGGRNGVDSPLNLPATQCVEALNIDWFDGNLGRKRRGGENVGLTGGTAFAGYIASMYRHVPDGNDANAELWAVDSTGLVKRLVAGTAWANVTIDDAISSNFQDICFATFNGKLFMAYNSTVNRLHVYDSAVTAIRRVGLAVTTVPTAANSGSGTYAPVTRYYRTRTIQLNGSIVVRRSEPSTALSVTPSGSGTKVVVSHGTFPSERETHWEVEVSLDNAVWYVLYGVGDTINNPIVIATATADDTTTAAGYLLLDTAQESGLFQLPPSAQFLGVDNNHLLMAGAYETGEPTSRVWFTPALASADTGDDERYENTVLLKGWVNLNEKDGGRITGLSPFSLQGIPYAYKYFRTYKLVPTSSDRAPYLPREVSPTVGCIYHKTIVMCEDQNGNPAIGFLSAKGPYRVGITGLIGIGRDVEDVWFGLGRFDTVVSGDGPVNLDAATLCAHGIYYSDLHQIWWWVPSGAVDSPNLKLVLDVKRSVGIDEYGVRGGWALHDGTSAKAVCSVMFAKTLGATMSKALRPYVGLRTPA